MKFFYDKQVRRLWIGTLALLVLLGASSAAQSRWQTANAQAMMVAHDRTVASALLQRGVSEETIAAALTNQGSTEQAAALLAKLGITQQTDPRFLPILQNLRAASGAWALLQTSIFAAALLLLLGVFFNKRSRLYANALETVSRFMEGDFTTLLPRLNSGPVYQLFDKINGMATALKSKQEAENRAKEFLKNTISDISHQLKTPLAALSMYTQIMQSEPEQAGTVAAFAQKSSLALGRMERLIQMLLKLARLDAGGIVFHKAPYAVGEVIAQSIEELEDRAKEEQKEIVVEGTASSNLVCDIEWTCEAIGNLVKNALDYTQQGGAVRIRWEQTPLMFHISIADTGNGIASEDIHHIFKRFYRSKHSLSANGIGLGLPLAKAIIEGQGGAITVRSQRGNGTTFLVSLPQQEHESKEDL